MPQIAAESMLHSPAARVSRRVWGGIGAETGRRSALRGPRALLLAVLRLDQSTPSPYAAPARSCGARKRELLGASCDRIERSAGIFGGIQIEVIMKSSWRRRGRRALRPLPKLQVAQDLFDDARSIDQAYDLQRAVATGTDQRVRLVDLLNKPCPGAPQTARAFVPASGMFHLRFGGLNGLAGEGAGISGAGAADVRPLAIVSVMLRVT